MRSFFILIAIFFSYTIAFSINNDYDIYQNWLKNEETADITKKIAAYLSIEQKTWEKYDICKKKWLDNCSNIPWILWVDITEISKVFSWISYQELSWIYESLSPEKKEALGRMNRFQYSYRLNTDKNIEIPKYRNPINWQILAISMYLWILLISWVAVLSFIQACCHAIGWSNENWWCRMFYVIFWLCIVITTLVINWILIDASHSPSFQFNYLTQNKSDTVKSVYITAISLWGVVGAFWALSALSLSTLLGLGYISRGFTTKSWSLWNRIGYATIKNSIILDSFNSRELLLLSIGFLPWIIYICLNQLSVASETWLLAITLILSKVAIFPAALKRWRELSISTWWVVFNYIFLPIFFTWYLLIQSKKTDEVPQKDLIPVN